MLEFIDNFLTFPFWVVSELFIYGFGILCWAGLFEILRHYKPWEHLLEWWRIKK